VSFLLLDVRLPPRCILDISSSAMLGNVD
jgi:hypothetical protein